MPDRRNAHYSIGVDYLVENAVRPNPKRPQALEPPLEQMASVWFAFQQCKGFRNGIDQWPIETQKLAASAPGEHDSRHG